MTIYSQHPNRGKVQVLATYRGTTGVVSSTVTSVEDSALAGRIVDALNRISACATVPVSVYDTRADGIDRYPTDHLAALTDRTTRAHLLEGAHSLWYELVKARLHQALSDLDDATSSAPAPVLKAITAELVAEAQGLRDALAEYSEGIDPPDTNDRREWDFKAPFVTFENADEVSGEEREQLDLRERGATDRQLREGAANLRLLLAASTQCDNHEAEFLADDFSITDDPFSRGEDRFFLIVEAPVPGSGYNRDNWGAAIYQWIPDDPEGDDGNATGEPVLQCTRSTPPTLAEIVELLNRSGGSPAPLAAWAKTPVGEALAGTTFVVTERSDG